MSMKKIDWQTIIISAVVGWIVITSILVMVVRHAFDTPDEKRIKYWATVEICGSIENTQLYENSIEKNEWDVTCNDWSKTKKP